MKFSTETLMAYADGELDAATRTAIEAAMAADPQVAQEVARHRALQAKLRAAFGDVINQTVPQHLISAARTAPAGTHSQVTDIAAARAARQGPDKRRWSWPEWGAIAASLMLGVIGGRMALVNDSGDAIVAENGRMIASGTLASALNTQPGGAATDGAKVQIGASFRAKTGEYCRTFNVNENAALAGVACRDADEWRVRALAQSEGIKGSGGYRMANTVLPPIIAQAVQETIDGDALDADEEAAARARGWKK
jgi:hypothetical protein